MSNNIVEEIKNRLSINTVMGHYLLGDKSTKGKRKYKCIFHGDGNEKTPSLYADDDRGSYYCFGCQTHGDIFSFVMKKDKANELTFGEAIEEIRDTFEEELQGIDFTYKGITDKDYIYKKSIYEFHEEINEFMIKALYSTIGKPFLNYLQKDRALDNELIERFKIGYSEKRKVKEFYTKLLQQDKYKNIKIEDTGLVTTNTENKEPFFLFADRIMYPIFNNRKKIVGWSGGKTYDEQNPKYINSINNFIYNKSANLFNFDKVKVGINDTIYICEGNLDSTQLYNYGADNAVSLLGTNLTESQIMLFKHKMNKAVLLLDNDTAGVNAIMKISKILLGHGIIPYIVNTKPQKDIDDFLKSNPQLKGNIKEYINDNKKDILGEYMIDGYILNEDRMSIDHKYELLTMVLDTYNSINDDVIRNIYKSKLKKHDIEFSNIDKEFKEKQKEENKAMKNADKENKNKVMDENWDMDKYILYAAYLYSNELITDEDLLGRNFQLHMILESNEIYNKYKDNLELLEKDFPELLIEFDLIKESKEVDLFAL